MSNERYFWIFRMTVTDSVQDACECLGSYSNLPDALTAYKEFNIQYPTEILLTQELISTL